MAEEEPDELEKIAQLAFKRGYWDQRAALEGAAMARLHHEGPRQFLKRLLERKCGLTYDELARLEKEALAPPPPPPPSKPLPKLGLGKPPSSQENPAVAAPQEIVTEAKIPRLDDPKPQAPPAEREQQQVSKKPLPKLNA